MQNHVAFLILVDSIHLVFIKNTGKQNRGFRFIQLFQNFDKLLYRHNYLPAGRVLRLREPLVLAAAADAMQVLFPDTGADVN